MRCVATKRAVAHKWAAHLVGAVTHDHIRHAVLPGLRESSADDQGVANRHAVPHRQRLNGARQVHVDQILRGHLDHHVPAGEVMLPGGVLCVQLVGARVADHHRNGHVKRYPKGSRRLEDGAGIHAARQDEAQLS